MSISLDQVGAKAAGRLGGVWVSISDKNGKILLDDDSYIFLSVPFESFESADLVVGERLRVIANFSDEVPHAEFSHIITEQTTEKILVTRICAFVFALHVFNLHTPTGENNE